MAWLGTWANRIEITIDCDKVDDTLTHFAVALHLSASCGLSSYDATAVFDDLGANKLKIAVTQADGTTQMYVDVADWDEGAEEAWLWVSIAGWSISSSVDTVIYLYYDSGQGDNTTYVSVSGDTPAQSVWASGYYLVDHLNDGASDEVTVDSSSNNADGAKEGSASPVEGTGKVGKCQVFDQTNWVDYGENFNFGCPSSMSCWFKCNGDYSTIQILIQQMNYEGSAVCDGSILYFGVTDNEFLYRTYVNSTRSLTSSLAISDDNWHHIAVVHPSDDLDMYIYFDGEFDVKFETNSAATADAANRGLVGARYAEAVGYIDYPFKGSIDEARIAELGFTAAWVKAEFNGGNDTLVTFALEGAEERIPRYGFTMFQDPGIV